MRTYSRTAEVQAGVRVRLFHELLRFLNPRIEFVVIREIRGCFFSHELTRITTIILLSMWDSVFVHSPVKHFAGVRKDLQHALQSLRVWWRRQGFHPGF